MSVKGFLFFWTEKIHWNHKAHWIMSSGSAAPWEANRYKRTCILLNIFDTIRDLWIRIILHYSLPGALSIFYPTAYLSAICQRKRIFSDQMFTFELRCRCTRYKCFYMSAIYDLVWILFDAGVANEKESVCK